MQELYERGARRILVFGVPPLGCIPSQRTVAVGVFRDCVVRYNDASKLYNDKLSANIDLLSRTLPDKILISVDIYNPFLEIILEPTVRDIFLGLIGNLKTFNLLSQIDSVKF